MQLTDADRIQRQTNPGMRRRAWLIAGLLAGVPLCFATAAMAQSDYRELEEYGIPRRYNPYYGGPGPYERDFGGPGPGYRGPAGMGFIPVQIIERRIRKAGFHLIAPPRHKGDIYLAEVEDRNDVRHRLVYDAYSGELLENTPLGPVKKPPAGDGGKAPKEGEPKPSRATKAVEPVKAEPAPSEQGKAAPPVPADTTKAPEAPAPAPAPAAKTVEEPAPAPTVPPSTPPSIVDDALKPAAPSDTTPAPRTEK